MRLFLKCKSGVILSSEQSSAEQSSFEQARTELFIAPLWDSLKWCKVERRSVTSCYHGSKFSGPQQSFLSETTICRLSNDGWKVRATISFRESNHVQECHTCRLFRFFLSHLQEHSLLRSRHFATMATWRKDFSSLCQPPCCDPVPPQPNTRTRTVRGRPFNSWGGGGSDFWSSRIFFVAIWWAGYLFPFFSHKLFMTFVLHAIFLFRQTLAGIFFSKSPPPPSSRVKWSAPNGLTISIKPL